LTESNPTLISSKTPFFGRAWSLTITPTTGPSANVPIVVSCDAYEPEALRVTFDINQFAFSAFWHAEFVVYNANGPITSGPSAGINLMQAVIQEGDVVTFSAGYQADYPYPATPPAIWTGSIFYTIQDRLDVVDERLTIHCLLSRALTTQNFLNDTIPMLSSQFTQARFIASRAANPIGINQSQIDRCLPSTSTKLPRGKSYFGSPHKYLEALADRNNLLSWFDGHGWNLDSLQNPVGSLVATYAPAGTGQYPSTVNGTKLSIIGQPQQTQLGVGIRVLLDPTVQIAAPLPQVAVSIEFTRQAPIPYPLPEGQFIAVPMTGQYVVVGVRFFGDTRGNAWYSDITGVTQIQQAIQLLGHSAQSDPTGN